jgi:competence protein ComEC
VIGARAIATRQRLAAAVAEARARPMQLAVVAVAVGLLAGPRAPVLVPLAVPLCVVLAPRALSACVIVAALLGGAVLADARLAALDRTALADRLGHAATERVTLLEPPRPRRFGGRAALVRLGSERVLLQAADRVRWPLARVGQELVVGGVLQRLAERDGWLRPRNVHARLQAERVHLTGRARGGVMGAVDDVRERAEAALSRGVPPPQAALLRGVVLGQDDALAKRTRDDFQAAGLAHLVAASGQNVMLLSALVFGVAAVAGLGLHARIWAALALIALYVPLAGAGASIQRAGVMGAAALTATLVGRPAVRWHALGLAAAVTLGMNPRAVEEPGWQMSFAAVAAITALCGRVAGALRRRGAPPGVAEALAMTIAATLATAPLVALHFGRTSLVSVPANLLAAPVVAPIMWLGMVAGVVGQVSGAAATPFTALAGVPTAYLSWLADTAARLPGADVAVAPVAVAAVCAVVAAGLLFRAARRPVVVAALVVVTGGVAMVGASDAPAEPPAGLRITFIDVGQGDATLIQHRRTTVLVDTGPPDGGIVTKLREAGVDGIDLLVVTHAQADHDGGAADVLRAMPVGLVLDGRDGVREPLGVRMATEAARRAVPRVMPHDGQTLRAGAIELRVLWPSPAPAGPPPEVDPNDRAIVAEALIGRVRILLTADAESHVLSRLDVGPVDVLKVPHHGSADPGLAALLERLRPKVAAIGVGAHNEYGHPVAATLEALRASGAALFRTDRDGNIRLEERGGRLTIERHA